MIISVIREKKQDEKRVIMMPNHVANLVKKGFTVWIETGAGLGCGFSDNDYIQCGAIIVDTDNAWLNSDIVIKYKAPIQEEYKYFRKGLKICALFHAEGNYELMEMLMLKKVTAFSFEFLKTADGIFPLAVPGGEIAGKSAIIHGAYYLQSQFGGSGRSIFDIHGSNKGVVTIVGYGNVGRSAAKLASDMGAEVFVFGNNVASMRKTSLSFDSNVQFLEMNDENFENVLLKTDILIGAILISTYETKPLITETHMKLLKKGSVVIDVTCGYGAGYMPSIKRNTTLDKPYYIENDLIYIKIDNLPLGYPISTVQAYTNNLFDYFSDLFIDIFNECTHSIVNSCIIFKNGIPIHEVIIDHLKYYEKDKL